MPLVGLTGGMGAGKSTALAALARQGAEVLSTDEVVHELYQGDGLREAVVKRWGQGVAPRGAVDRAAIAERAFGSQEDRIWLEQLLWPQVGQRIVAWVEKMRMRRAPPRAAVIEVPLLFESGTDGICDVTVVVIADQGLIDQRTSDRAHAAVAERQARQLSQEEKAQRATFVVTNDGTVEDLERQLSAVLEKLGG
jgi:dephospho-CoA kinase